MPATKVVERSLRSETRDRVLPDRLQHEQPDLTVGDVAPEQAAGHERLEVPEEARRAGERTGVVEGAAAHEDGERLMQLPLALAEQAVAPVDRRPQRALPLRKVDGALHVEREPLVEREEELGGRKDCEPGSNELDGEGEPVETPTDLAHSGERVLVQDDTTCGGELGEERGRVVDRQRLEGYHVLAGEPERRAARDQDVDVRRAVEQSGHMAGRAGEMLEVVEEEQRAGAFHGLRDAFHQRSVGGLAHAQRVRDRLRDERGIGDGREPYEVNRALHGPQPDRLEREPALAGAPGPCDRHEPHVRTGEQRQDRGQVLAPADEAVMQCREHRPSQRAKRRERHRQAGGDELEELLGGRDVLEPVVPERAERDPLEVVADEVPCRARDDDLSAMRRPADPGCDDHVHADIAFVAELRLAGVDPDPQTYDAVRRPGLVLEGVLELRGREDGVARPREREEDAVPGPVDLVTAVRRSGLADEHAQACPDRREACSERVQQSRRALDVGEDERHRPAREALAPHVRSAMSARVYERCALTSEPLVAEPVVSLLRLPAVVAEMSVSARLLQAITRRGSVSRASNPCGANAANRAATRYRD